MLVYTPIDLPKLQPDNWNIFWDIWNEHSKLAVKTQVTQNSTYTDKFSNLWNGLDIFSRWNIKTVWQCPYVDISNNLPLLHNSILKLSTTIPSLFKVRLLESLGDFVAHSDTGKDFWEIRGYFYYTDTSPQWYFTRPNDTNRIYPQFPKETQWFSYNDRFIHHGTDFNKNHKKILIQLFFIREPKELITLGSKTYKEYTISLE
jgi:hypothetical protein